MTLYILQNIEICKLFLLQVIESYNFNLHRNYIFETFIYGRHIPRK